MIKIYLIVKIFLVCCKERLMEPLSHDSSSEFVYLIAIGLLHLDVRAETGSLQPRNQLEHVGNQ